MVEAVRATDFLLGRDEWGAEWIRCYRAKQAADSVSAVVDLPEEPHPDRVRLRYLQLGEDRAVKEARVPAGTTLFDAASWNGVAIDSTCGGHGTCKKCKVRVVSGTRRSARSTRARSPRRAPQRLAARLPRRRAGGPDGRGAAAADAAEGRARRRRPARDPAAGRAEALRRARGADARGSALGSRAPARRDGRRRAARAARASCARSATRCASPTGR